MADKRITELPAIDTVQPGDLLLVVDDPTGSAVNKKATVSQLLSGSVAPPKLSCSVFNSADVSIPNATPTPLAFDSERYDADNMHNPAVNPDRITIPTTGLYLASAVLSWSPTSSVGTRQAALAKNGSHVVGNVVAAIAGAAPPSIDILLVGGGGGGGRGFGAGVAGGGGGGGGGGVIVMSNVNLTSVGALPVVVGAGGAVATKGDDSAFLGHIAIGGGAGGSYDGNTGTPGGPGGSGGGGAGAPGPGSAGGAPTAGQGFGGGAGYGE